VAELERGVPPVLTAGQLVDRRKRPGGGHVLVQQRLVDITRPRERRGHVEDDLAVLDRDHPASGGGAAVAVAVHPEQGRPPGVARAQEVAVQRVRQPARRGGLAGRVQRLRGDLPAEQGVRLGEGHAGPVDVLLDVLQVEQVEDRRQVCHYSAAFTTVRPSS
jgi:hypothetical protein